MNATPAQHLLIVVRERLGDSLLGEGCNEEQILYADSLARAYWSGATLDVLLADLRFILDSSDYACKLHYPITFLTIPPALRWVDESLFRPLDPAHENKECK